MKKVLAADWFRRFLAGFAMGLVATVFFSTGGIHAQASADENPLVSAPAR